MPLTASAILSAQLKAEQMWADSALMKAKIPHSDTAIAVLQNQTPRFEILKDKNKDYVARVMWLDPCGGGVRDCTPSCTITGSGVDSLVDDYVLNRCKETVPTSIGEEVFRTNQYTQEEAIALKMMEHKKALDEYLSIQLLVQIKAFAGPNFFPGAYTAANGTTYIPNSDYNVSLLPYLETVADQNQMSDTYKISNVDFYAPYRNAMINAGNLDGKGDAFRAEEIARDLYFDRWNFNRAGITEDMFIIDRGAMAFVTKSRFETKPVYIGGDVQQWRWSEASNILPGVSYDFFMTETCNPAYSATQEDIVTNFKAKVHFGIFQNPLGCTVTLNGVTGKSTGIISLSKGTAPVV